MLNVDDIDDFTHDQPTTTLLMFKYDKKKIRGKRNPNMLYAVTNYVFQRHLNYFWKHSLFTI